MSFLQRWAPSLRTAGVLFRSRMHDAQDADAGGAGTANISYI